MGLLRELRRNNVDAKRHCCEDEDQRRSASKSQAQAADPRLLEADIPDERLDLVLLQRNARHVTTGLLIALRYEISELSGAGSLELVGVHLGRRAFRPLRPIGDLP
eukprot:CAMPEP_0180699280 /NCGR_PEP_ID=MMETSP1038_2-20121128/4468_1 /TAXON_ID=632150 /ORGANISM="Azadinium spinosum, Strain 3D9" /LENGTH=105 /DNA_ID=CAMNT_0022730895 /DNA_START=304 /DNA_END=621 /DNA_ORIENTATION=+